MWEAVWGGCHCQHQPWSNDIILTPQVTQNPKICVEYGGGNCVTSETLVWIVLTSIAIIYTF